MKTSQKGFAKILIILVMVIVVGTLVGGVMYGGWELFKIKSQEKNAEGNPIDVSMLAENWKEYKNEKFNITFKYPSDLTFDVKDDEGSVPSRVSFKSSKGNPVFNVAIYDAVGTYGVTGAEYLSQRMAALKTDSPDISVSTTTIDSEKAFLAKSCLPNGNCTSQVYTARGNYYYQIFEAIRLDSTINPQIFDGVVATFKFIK